MEPFNSEHRFSAETVSDAVAAEYPEVLNVSDSVDNGQKSIVNNGQEIRCDNGQEFSIDHGQQLGKRSIAMAMGNEHNQVMTYSSQEVVRQMFDLFTGKRRKLNTQDPCNTKKKMMDLGEDGLYAVFLALIGGERPKNVRPRQLKNLQSAFSFVLTNSRILQFFRTCVCDKIHTLDTIYPVEKGDEDVLYPSCQARPESISFLSSMVGSSLRVIRLASFQDVNDGNETLRRDQLIRARSLMMSIAKNCHRLTEITFQDAGSADSNIAKLLFLNNARLKKLQVDIPSPELMHALGDSLVNLEILILFKVQPASLSGLKKVLGFRGASLRQLAIEMVFPLDKGFEATPANKARCRRREKTFTESIEVLTRLRMKSLRSLHLYPDRRAAWFKVFIRHFQLLGQADLYVGRDWMKLFHPAAKTLDPPKPMFKRMALDALVSVPTEQVFEEYVVALHEPDTVSITKGGFVYAFVSERFQHLEQFTKSIIYRKGKDVTKLHLTCPCLRIQVFEVFMETVAEILNFFEEKFESLDQFKELWIPMHLVKYLGRGLGYETFIARLSNLKVIHLVKTVLDANVGICVPIGIPTFLRGIMNACPDLESIYIADKDFIPIHPDVKKEILDIAIEDALIALDEYEEAKPKLDTWTLRKQLAMWSEEASRLPV